MGRLPSRASRCGSGSRRRRSRIGGAASGGGATAAVAAKTAVATSKLVLGLILGASLTVGVAGAVIVGAMSIRDGRDAVRVVVATPRSLERAADVRPDVHQGEPALITGHVAPATEVIELPNKPAEPARVGTATDSWSGAVAPRVSERDRLAREARMVNEARGALHRGEPDVALRIVRAARFQPGARLVPEELTVEAQALRATGDEAGAQRVLDELASKFPDGQLPGH